MAHKGSKPIAIIGYRGTGKTTVARFLATRLGCDWVDTDVEVELRGGKSIAARVADGGERVFRDMEDEVVAKWCDHSGAVLALGGGAVLSQNTRSRLAQCRAVVWLRASAMVIAERLAADETTPERRPNLTNHGGRTEIDQLLAEREPIYRSCATLEVDTEDKQPAEIAEEIAVAIGAAG